MPRIEAPTVAEHHEMRRAALIAAAGDLLATRGVEAVTLAAVGAAAGLARSSVYQYFDSTGSLLAALMEQEVPRATAHLASVVARAGDPTSRVEAYVKASLRAATDDNHRAVAALGWADLPRECQDRLVELHKGQLAPLVDALVELGARDPEITATLIYGLVRTAAAEINTGGPRTRVTRATLALIRDGLPGQRSCDSFAGRPERP
jgi:AcrR family transcriptional regulator